MGWLCGVRVFGLVETSHSLPTLHCWLYFIDEDDDDDAMDVADSGLWLLSWVENNLLNET